MTYFYIISIVSILTGLLFLVGWFKLRNDILIITADQIAAIMFGPMCLIAAGSYALYQALIKSMVNNIGIISIGLTLSVIVVTIVELAIDSNIVYKK